MTEGVFLQRHTEQPHECAERKSEAGRERDGGKRISHRAGLPENCKAGRRARPVADGEQECAKCGAGGPAVCKQKGAKREQVGDIGKCAPGEITEDDERHDELVCREAEQKGRQNDSVQTEEAPKRIEKGGHAPVQGAAADRDVCEQPDERTGRRRNNHRAAEHEHRAVEHAAHDHPARLRRAVGRKLQHERGGQTAQKEG